MTRILTPGLVAEGDTDEVFLGIVITRQLRELTWGSSRCSVIVEETEVGSCRSIMDADRVGDTLRALSADCHVLFVHNDHRERGKVSRVIAEVGVATPVVGLVPVRETEAWLLADAHAWQGVKGSRADLLPSRPAGVESILDPKKVLDRVVPPRGRPIRDYFEYIGRNINLDVLAQVPAYAVWVTETKNVLKGLGYL
ncbi:hypothetical protein [Nonomuraea sp. NPDC046570]|uniref:hypothetical protein n=1 Tax=Nonomuraea sp. NPDC046570 TaxID=3155255 RepID=UPI003408C483